MTKYRTVSNGRWEYLQYQYEKKSFFGLRTKLVWGYVPRPHRWRYEGGYRPSKDEMCVSSLDFDLIRFIAKWKNIDDYFKFFQREQKKIVDAIIADDERVNSKRGTVRTLN